MESREIDIAAGDNTGLKGNLDIPPGAGALVIFSHGSGSSRFSTRNRAVAETLNRASIATLLVDLLTEEEDRAYENRFNIDLLASRLMEVTRVVRKLPELEGMPVGYFGASTGAASALKAAVGLQDQVDAIVSRGGRPDLAGDALQEVKAPTLLIIGSLDRDVIRLNDFAYSRLLCEKEMTIVEGAAHLFEEPGKLEEVAMLALEWFRKHLHPVHQD
jgi:putative phosphoribosyl transferase